MTPRRAGFTLLEVLVATTVMAIAVAGLLTAISTSLRNAARLTDYDRAALAARHKMDELLLESRLPKMDTFGGLYDPAQFSGMQAGWRARVTPFERPPIPAPGLPMLERVELQIWWIAGGKEKNFSLEAFHRVTLLPADVTAGAGAESR